MAILSDASQVMAAEPNPSAPTAPPAPPAPVNGGIVDAAQQTAPPSQPAPQAQPTSNQPTNGSADDAHHSLLGRAIKHVISATEGVDYQADANGQVKPVPAQPGSFFRRLVAGMLVAGAAGAGQKTFTGGFGAGAQAASAQGQQIDQQKYARAQQAVKDRQEQSRIDDDVLMHKAQIAHLNLQIADWQHNQHAADQETVERHNAAARAYENQLTDSGGSLAKLSINGKPTDTFSASDLASAYVKDPSIAHAPDGYGRHFVDTTNLSELHFDGEHWTDDGGNPVSMGANSTIRAYDLPTSTFKSYRQVSGAEINKIRGAEIVDSNKNYSVSPEGLSALYTLGVKEAAETARAAAQRTRAEKAAKRDRQSTAIEQKKAAALAKAESTYWSELNSGKDENNALAQLNAAKQSAQDSYEAEIRAAGGSPQHYDYSGSPAPQTKSTSQARSNPQNAPKTFSPSKWAQANPGADVNAAIQEAKRQNLQIIQ